MFSSYFASVYEDPSNSCKSNSSSNLGKILYLGYSDNLATIELSKDEILKKLKGLDIAKGAGPDNIPPIFIKTCATSLTLPLYLIFKASLRSGKFPTVWKQAKVVPIFKSDDKKDIRNYRPISILSVFAKVFESLVCPLIQMHFKCFVSEHQHGFLPGRSTSSNLVSFTTLLSQAIDSQKQVDTIYTDFKKAFDKIPHNILIEKLSYYGFSDPLLQWLASYLTGRSFCVVANGFSSLTHSITSGIPQGSHLGPILFNIFVNDIVLCFEHSTPYLYADDLKFSRIINSPRDSVLLQNDFNRLVDWCTSNSMQLNSNKCLHIKFTRKRNIIPTQYNLNGESLKEVNLMRDLGVTLDSKLTFLNYIENVISKASKLLGFIIRQGKTFKDPKTKIILYNSLVRSRLEYCSVVWRPHYATHNLRLERVQKRFLWHLSFAAKIYKTIVSYRDRVKYFKMMTLEKRRDLLDLLFLYKLLRNKVDCPSLLSKINFRAPKRYPRSPITPLVPPPSRTVLGANTILPRLCKLYNERSQFLDINANPPATFRKLVTLDLVKSSAQK